MKFCEFEKFVVLNILILTFFVNLVTRLCTILVVRNPEISDLVSIFYMDLMNTFTSGVQNPYVLYSHDCILKENLD